MVRFYAWLQTIEFGIPATPATLGRNTAAPSIEALETAPASGTSQDETAPLLVSSPTMPTPSDIARDDNDRVRFRPRYRDHKPEPSVPIGTPVAWITRISHLEEEIEKPSRWDIDRGALQALQHWNLRTRYFDIVAVRREEKRELLRLQLKNVRAKEEEARSWRKWIMARVKSMIRVLVSVLSRKSKTE